MTTAEQELWDTFAERTAKTGTSEVPSAFEWTQYGGHGPGTEILGRTGAVMELGFGSGKNLAYLAHQGVDVVGVDLSPVQCKLTAEQWPRVDGSRFIHADAVDHLSGTSTRYDAMYSVFGAVWFTDPRALLPAVHRALKPGGLLAFSHPPAIDGCYGAQGMYKGGFSGRALFLRRYCYTPEMWAGILLSHGFMDVRAEVIEAPEPEHIGTLLVRATAAP